MSAHNKRKIINDPVFGFINVPNDFLYDIIQHPIFQRLQRIKQLGLASFVYPGAQHTRFQHSLGAMYLTNEAIKQLRQNGHEITSEEADGVLAAILLHDIGHGPFSHVLENTLVSGISHEEISLRLMQQMNSEMDGKLTLAIRIFQDQYPKHFLHQLISSQLDMDRMDYLRRDSFFTGVTEGVIGSARLIKMLDVYNDQLVIEAKGIHSIENFLIARRFMYWQVYFHKTAVAAEDRCCPETPASRIGRGGHGRRRRRSPGRCGHRTGRAGCYAARWQRSGSSRSPITAAKRPVRFAWR